MKFFSDLWISFGRLPLWVKVWVFLILVPVNMATLVFIEEPGSTLIASLAMAAIVFNVFPMWFDRGFTNGMAVSHVIFWVPLVPILIYHLLDSEIVLANDYRYFLVLLLVCNMISLAFDIPDTVRWVKERRG